MESKITANEKLLMVLNTFMIPPHEFTAIEISEMLGLNKSTIHRILNTLVQYKYIDKNKQGRYKIGYSSYLVGMQYPRRENVYRDIRKIVDNLSKATNQQAGYSVLEGYSVVSVYESQHYTDTIIYMPGEVYPVNCGVYGKVLMANTYTLPELKEIVYELNLDNRYPNAIKDANILYREYERTKLLGYALSDGEHIKGEMGIGAPTFNSRGKLHGCIAISGMKNQELLEKKLMLIDEVKNSAKMISNLLA